MQITSLLFAILLAFGCTRPSKELDSENEILIDYLKEYNNQYLMHSKEYINHTRLTKNSLNESRHTEIKVERIDTLLALNKTRIYSCERLHNYIASHNIIEDEYCQINTKLRCDTIFTKGAYLISLKKIIHESSIDLGPTCCTILIKNPN